MHIVLDGSPLTVETGGIRRYTEELALALKALHAGDTVTVLSDRPLVGDARLRSAGVQVFDAPAAGWRKRWWSLGLSDACRRLGASVFHGTDFAVPYLHTCPAVMTIHDLSPWRFPQWQPRSGRIRTRTPWLLRLGMADMVLTVSEAVRREVLEEFGLHAARVAAVPLGVRVAAGNHSETVAVQSGGGPFCSRSGSVQPYFLFVGTIEPRKNLATLLEAWRLLPEQDRPELWIAGRLRQDGATPPHLPGLRWLGAVSDEELADLYRHALALLCPSYYEGFGLPVLEAMHCATPVVVSSTPALRELVGGAAPVLPADQPRLWAEHMHKLGHDAAVRAQMAEKCRLRAGNFPWETTAARTRMVYQEAIERFGH